MSGDTLPRCDVLILPILATRDWNRPRRIVVVCAASAMVIAIIALMISPAIDANAIPVQHIVSASNDWRTVGVVEPSEIFPMFRPGRDGAVHVQSPQLDLSADVCATPELLASCSAQRLRYSLAWRRQGDPFRYQKTGVATGSRGPESQFLYDYQLALPDLPLHPGWKGRITSIEWSLYPGEASVALVAAGAPRAGGRDLARIFWKQWWSHELVDGVSINSVRAPHVLGWSPAAISALGALIAFCIYVLVAVLRGRPIRVMAFLLMLLLAWGANDMRWLVGQWKQLDTDRERAATPAEQVWQWPAGLERMAQAARESIPANSIYAVVGGNLGAWASDSRLRYLLAPRLIQVNLDPLQPQVPTERAAYIVVLDPGQAEFDPSTGRFDATGLPAMQARLIAGVQGGGYIVQRIEP